MKPPLSVRGLPIAGLYRIERRVAADARGSFSRLFDAELLAAAGWSGPVVQVNLSRTAQRGTVRGLHFQRPPHADAKLVSCIRGAVFDVALDLRRGSASFGLWHGETLAAADGAALLLAEGFAHGFQALTDDAELVYCHGARYEPAAEGGLNPLDPALAIAWPLPPVGLSPRDLALPALDAAFEAIAA